MENSLSYTKPFALIFLALLLFFTGCGSSQSVMKTQGGISVPEVTTPPVTVAEGCTENFASDIFTAGASVHNQNGWYSDPAAHFNEKVVNLGSGACRGKGVWQISNNIVSGGFGNQPASPAFSKSAGESTVRTAGGGDSMDVTFWIKPASLTADGSSLTLSYSPTSADRHNYLRILNDTDAHGGFRLVIIDYYDFNNNTSGRTFNITGLDRSKWLKIKLVSQNPDGPLNDTLQLYLNDVFQGVYSSWEDLRTSPSGFNSVTLDMTRTLWRMSALPSALDPSFTDGGAQGFYIDDFSQTVYNAATPGTLIESYSTGFEVP